MQMQGVRDVWENGAAGTSLVDSSDLLSMALRHADSSKLLCGALFTMKFLPH